MTRGLPARCRRAPAAALSLALLAAGCASEGPFSSDTIDYRSAPAKAKSLEVPPDLTQLARETRYPMQGGVVSAAAASASAPAAASPSAGTSAGAEVAPLRVGEIRIERQGQQRWLVVPTAPELLWPRLREFWEKSGFTLALDDPRTGLMETNWSENRARIPADAVRNLIGRLLNNLFDSGERDLFRTRVERSGEGSEVYISHRGIQETFVGVQRENTTWRARPSDPELEAEMLARLMNALGRRDEAARPATVAAAVAAAPAAPARARVVGGTEAASLEVDESFERAWRRVGLALDRGGFTVEDRDRSSGVFFVRWVDPTTAGQEEPNFFARVFGGAKEVQPVRYRIVLKGAGPKTTISVQTSAGAPEPGENGQRIVAQLVNELK